MQTSSVVLCSLLAATTALGQITPDNTLGNESSLVTPNVNVKGNRADLIEGGAIRESNLFHSFSDFNVAQFGRVYFTNPAGIQNIITRVTGTNISNILGTLGVQGNANLFLINPNGIFFGPNSRLDLGGSFFGSTADGVLFEDGTVFSAKNPNEKPLLTINIPSGLQYGSNPGSITNQSFFGLQVPNGQTLGLIGGEVNIPGGSLRASDGRIELGSVGSNNVVKLIPTDTSFGFDYSGVQGFQDISLSERAGVSTIGESGGSIQVRGAKVSLRDRSFVFADTNGSGSGGGIVVKASQLSLEGGSEISTFVFGSGQGGDLTVDASESVRVIGVSANGTLSALRAQVVQGAAGNAGDVTITTGQLIVSDGAFVSADTMGEGDGGNLTVDADSKVQLIGTSADGVFPSGLFTDTFGKGKAGELNITTGQLIVSDGALVSASTASEGDGGDVTITTGQLIVSDGAQVNAITTGEGDGGNLTVDASESVQVIGTSASGESASGLSTQAQGTGNAGDLKITTGKLMVSDGAQVSANASGGEAGKLTVDASESVQVIGTSASGESASGLSTQAQGTGNAGDLKITTGKLMVSDGAQVSANASGGEAGKLTVNASESVQVIGPSADGRRVSGLFTKTDGTGKAGDLSITTGQLIVSDGAQVSANASGGDGGKLTVDASESVQVIGSSANGRRVSGLFTETEGTGNAGDLNITTGQLIVKDGARVSTTTFGEGDGGNLTVDASESVQVIGSSANGRRVSGLFAQANPGSKGKAGDVNITTGQLIVKDGAGVSASTASEGDGGDVNITTGELIISDGAQVSA
ncbi:filamentous hemagglutinin N-terminal domain-containing protein, partial [Moorena sp. SIO4G3]|uniref:two-partner secretion domain-containing protein n=1 Tax=Moorena sp. SIO4G3 TaxID=2607821 RepID=UPI00142BF47F